MKQDTVYAQLCDELRTKDETWMAYETEVDALIKQGRFAESQALARKSERLRARCREIRATFQMLHPAGGPSRG